MSALGLACERGRERLGAAALAPRIGKVTRVVGLAVEAAGITAPLGDLCEIRSPGGRLRAEVVGFRDGRLLLMPLGELLGVHPGSQVWPVGERAAAPVGPALVGRVLDGLGRPLDGRGPLEGCARRVVHAHQPVPAMGRRPIETPLETGIRAIDSVLPLGRGQRVGIFSGSGVGKSTLLGQLAGRARADVSVVALIGERGREVREFVERDLGPEGLARAVVVVATADEPPVVRRHAAFLATAVAEGFRDGGAEVLLVMDSLTRLAMAQREIGLAVGEPPATRGYPPSVFALMPRLLERAGTASHRGSITGIYTVLVEGDDLNDPVADALRAALDGHIVLSRELAAAGHFPPVDVLPSVSRLADRLLTLPEQQAAAALRDCLAAYRDARDLVAIGAYVRGSDARTDRALGALDAITAFLRQGRAEWTPRAETMRRLAGLVPRPAAAGTSGSR